MVPKDPSLNRVNSIALISDNEKHTEFGRSKKLSLPNSLLSLLSCADNLIKTKIVSNDLYRSQMRM